MNAAVLAALVPGAVAWLVGIILVILLPVAIGLAMGWLLNLPGRLRRTESLPPAAVRPANPGRKRGGKK